MTDAMTAALIAGLFGVLAGAAPTWLANRRNPSRRTTDTVHLVDASGQVISNLTAEIARLDNEVLEARAEADGARTEARACRTENNTLKRRIDHLEEALRAAGLDPEALTN